MLKSHSIPGRLRVFRMWFMAVRTLDLIQGIMLAAAVMAAVALLADRLLAIGLDWPRVVRGFAWLQCAIVPLLFILRPVSLRQTARIVDRSAGLKNLVSSGLQVMREEDEASGVVRRRANEALAHQSPMRALPARLTRAGRLLPVVLACLALAWLVPQKDLLGRQARREQARRDQARVQDAFVKLAASLSAIDGRTLLSREIQSNAPAHEFAALATNLIGLSKQDALLKLGEFESKYKEEFASRREFKQAAMAIKPDIDLGGLPPDMRRPMDDLAKGLNQGDMKKAARALKDISSRLKSSKLPPEDRKALARELAKIMEQMREKGAGPGDEIAKMLKDIEASPEDLEALLKKCEVAGCELDELADFCDQCEGMSAMKEGLREAKKSMLGDSFKELDSKAVEAMMDQEAALACLGTCQADGQLGGAGSGYGTGGQGRGQGGVPLENASDTAFVNRMSPGKVRQGRVLHQMFVSGVPEKGEALTEYSEALESARQDAASSLARDRIPREYEGMIKTYFDSLEPENMGKQEAGKTDADTTRP